MIPDERAEFALQPEIYDPRPPTPPQLKRFANKLRGPPGHPVIHPGSFDVDRDALAKQTHGYKPRLRGEATAKEAISAPPKSILMKEMEAVQESIYASHRQKPLGKPFQHGYAPPNAVKENPSLAFGNKSDWGNVHAGDTLPGAGGAFSAFNLGEDSDSENAPPRTLRHHGKVLTGQQLDRQYSWPEGVDPVNTRWGVQYQQRAHEATASKEALAWDDPSGEPARVAPEIVVARNKRMYGDLGKPRVLGIRPAGSEDRSAGVDLSSHDKIGAGRLIHGQIHDSAHLEAIPIVSDSQLQHQKEVAARTKAPPVPQGHQHRTFGVPSVRYDVVEPVRKSVAHQQNYGLEKGAALAIQPEPFAYMGVLEEDFSTPRPKEQVMALMVAVGFSKDTVDGAWEEALAAQSVADADARAKAPPGAVNIAAGASTGRVSAAVYRNLLRAKARTGAPDSNVTPTESAFATAVAPHFGKSS